MSRVSSDVRPVHIRGFRTLKIKAGGSSLAVVELIMSQCVLLRSRSLAESMRGSVCNLALGWAEVVLFSVAVRFLEHAVCSCPCGERDLYKLRM